MIISTDLQIYFHYLLNIAILATFKRFIVTLYGCVRTIVESRKIVTYLRFCDCDPCLSSQTFTNGYFQKEGEMCFSMKFSQSCSAFLLARLRKFHVGTEEKSRQEHLYFPSHPVTAEERIHHTSRFLSYAQHGRGCFSIELLHLCSAFLLASTHKQSLPERSKNTKRT
ncbi:MAG: hypothetical protein PWP37_1069 [Thermotogota bacterium]|nr:hypothetical protein [Thermotogota bacterium]